MAVTYETFFVLDPTINDEMLGKISEKIAGFIKEKNGTVLKQENWGKQKLAAPIRKRSEGIYLYFNYSAPPTIVDELKQFLKYEEMVLRNFTTKQEVVRKSRFAKKQKGELTERGEHEQSEPIAATGGTESVPVDTKPTELSE
ncbi:MAG: 30S ribosomal protein S6 [bacterium]|nr:30S ribosomal protein S6 [bacterium]